MESLCILRAVGLGCLFCFLSVSIALADFLCIDFCNSLFNNSANIFVIYEKISFCSIVLLLGINRQYVGFC